MQTKRIYIEAKKSANFQTYTVGLDIETDLSLESEELELLIKKAQAKCRKLARDQINIDSMK